MQLNKDQKEAVDIAFNKRFSYITGPAGSGKTTIIKQIANEIEWPILVCPTGKAASRMREATEMPCSTIHKELKFIGDGFMGGDIIGQNWIIDEASMVDSQLLYEIIKRQPATICLVGDYAQLQPVGKGAPFHNIVDFFPAAGVHLKLCYRNREAIYQSAMLIRDGQMPEAYFKTDNELWQIEKTSNPAITHQNILDMVIAGDLDFSQDIIICCRNGTEEAKQPCTVMSLNGDISNILLPRDGKKWRTGDRIICRKNFSKYDVWNGTTGTIAGLSFDGKKVYVRGDIPFIIDGEKVEQIEYPTEVLKECQLAYAITAHRSQGSQYRKVIFAINDNDFILLNRNLIYTVVTRAINGCHVIGSITALMSGINKKAERITVMDLINKGE